MRFVAFNYEQHSDWVREVIAPVFCEDTRGIVALRDDNSIAGAIIMDSWAPNSVQVHIGAETPLVFKHGLHKEAANYIFNTAGRNVVIGLTPSNNEKAIKINKHLGFKEIFRVPDAYLDGVDYIVFRMDRHECTYLED